MNVSYTQKYMVKSMLMQIHKAIGPILQQQQSFLNAVVLVHFLPNLLHYKV